MKTPKSKVLDKLELEKYIDKSKGSIAIFDDTAYWKINGQIFFSQIDEFGEIDVDNAKKIDVFSLSEIEMKNLFKILDKLNKG